MTSKDKGKIEQRTLVDFSKEPKEGMIPVEAWDEGKKIHFGNQITKIEKPKTVEAEKPKEETLYHGTRENFDDYDFDRSGGMAFLHRMKKWLRDMH